MGIILKNISFTIGLCMFSWSIFYPNLIIMILSIILMTYGLVLKEKKDIKNFDSPMSIPISKNQSEDY